MELFGVGIGEAGLVLLIALLVVGPERFPQIAREGGKWYRMARRFTAEVTADLQGALKELEDEVNQQGDELKAVREIGDDVRAGMRASSEDIASIGRGVGASASAADLSKPGAPAADPPTATAASLANPEPEAEEAALGVVQSNPDVFARVRASYADLHQPTTAVPATTTTSPEIDPDEMAQHATEAFETFHKPEPTAVVSGGNPFGGGSDSAPAAPAVDGKPNGTDSASAGQRPEDRPAGGSAAPAPAAPRTDA